MFTKNQNDLTVDREITAALEELESLRGTPEKYNATVERIGRLQKMKTRKGVSLPSPDTMLIVSANIFGILWLAHFERSGSVIKTPNAFKNVMKPGSRP
jgi:hypothetical protein